MARASITVRGAAAPGSSEDYAILNALAAHVAVLNSDGVIVFTNKSWNQFAKENGNPSRRAIGPGASYIGVCHQAVLDGAPGAQAILTGIQDVLAGKQKAFSIEYPCDSPTEQRWFAMNVRPMQGGAVTAHLDITHHMSADNAEERHRHNQELKTILDNSPDAIVRLDRKVRCVYVNPIAAKAAGLPAEAFLGKTPDQVGLPKTLCDLWRQTFRDVVGSRRPRVIEVAFPLGETETIWEEHAVPEFAADGSVQSVLMIGRDMTERKKLEKAQDVYAQENLALAGRLLKVEGEERRRIARELHDSILQQLGVLTVEAEGLVNDFQLPELAQDRLRTLKSHLLRVTEEARHIAYKMHPAILDDLGLTAALGALSNDFARDQRVIVKFREGRQPSTIPLKVAACLYRIAQESFQNIAKYAEAKTVTVQLKLQGKKLLFSIEDDGKGFDKAAVRGHGRLGLVSMEERSQLIGATFSIESNPGQGTRITVTIPQA